MFGLMELTEQLNEPAKLAIIPTVVIPFTILGMILTSLATWIAAFFGLQLKAEGPKRLFELLMKPKILAWALVMNLLFYGFYKGGLYLKNSSMPIWLIEFRNASLGVIHPEIVGSKMDRPPSVASHKHKILEKIQLQNQAQNLAPRPIKNVEIVWQHDLKSAVFGGLAASENSLFMGTRDGSLIELDANTGNKLKEIWIGQPIMTQPILLNEQVYFGEGVHETHHARYYNFDRTTGRLNSAFKSTGHIERKAAVAYLNQPHQTELKKLLLVPAGRDGVYALDSKTMTPVWQSKTGHVDASPIADDQNVYFGTGVEKGFEDTEAHVVAVNLATGTTLWKKSIPTSSWGIPVLWKNLVCFGIGDVYKSTTYGQFSCYNRKTGEQDLAINTDGALISEPTLVKDYVVLADVHGVIYQLNLIEKKIDWKIQTPSAKLSYASVFVDQEDRLFLPSDDGLLIFSRKTQNLLYQWKYPAAHKKPWKKPYTNILAYQDLWILADGHGEIWGLRPLY